MKFKDWLEESKIPMSVIGRTIGMAGSTVQKAKYGLFLSFQNAEKLSAFTGGKVTIQELTNPARKKKRRKICPVCGCKTYRF